MATEKLSASKIARLRTKNGLYNDGKGLGSASPTMARASLGCFAIAARSRARSVTWDWIIRDC